MKENDFRMNGLGHIIAAISPLCAALAIYALFIPWVSGKFLVVGKTITALNFPRVFWSVLIGCVAILVVYIWAIFTRKITKRRPVIFILSFATLAATSYFLYAYGQESSMPGVRISFHGGILICFIGLILAVGGSIIPLSIFGSKKANRVSAKTEKSKPGHSEIQSVQ